MRLPPPLADGRQRDGEDAERRDPERQVDVEDRAPRDVRGEEAADQRPGDARDAEDRAEQPRVLAALARRHDVADRRLGADHQPAAAEALDRPERDQLRHPLRQPAQRRADQEQHERALEHDLAAVEVAELAVQRRHRRHREQVRRDHPRQVLEPTELAHDRRQRRRHDRLVERREQHHQHQPADHDEDPAAVGRRGHRKIVLLAVDSSDRGSLGPDPDPPRRRPHDGAQRPAAPARGAGRLQRRGRGRGRRRCAGAHAGRTAEGHPARPQHARPSEPARDRRAARGRARIDGGRHDAARRSRVCAIGAARGRERLRAQGGGALGARGRGARRRGRPHLPEPQPRRTTRDRLAAGARPRAGRTKKPSSRSAPPLPVTASTRSRDAAVWAWSTGPPT